MPGKKKTTYLRRGFCVVWRSEAQRGNDVAHVDLSAVCIPALTAPLQVETGEARISIRITVVGTTVAGIVPRPNNNCFWTTSTSNN